MAKIYLTGMTAPQASPNANLRSLTFTGVLHKVLVESGNDVYWGDPSVTMTAKDLEMYDSVIVGIAPLTSLSSNRVYGALNLISQLWGTPKLKFVIDAPGVNQINVSLKAINNTPENFVKPFYSYRKDYAAVSSDTSLANRLLITVENLLTQPWPKTIYPKLPWKTLTEHSLKLPDVAKGSLEGINLDSFLLEDSELLEQRAEKWVVDTYATDWAKNTLAGVALPNAPMKWNKATTDIEVFSQICRGMGVLISPHKKDGTWWSYRYIQALNSRTPIVTDWQESQHLGQSWSFLAATIEDLASYNRELLAIAQKDLYTANIPNKDSALYQLKSVLEIH